MNRFITLTTLSCLIVGLTGTSPLDAAETERTASEPPKTRSFRIDYGATLSELSKGAKVRVWLPVPQSNEYQEVNTLQTSLPAEGTTSIEPKYGNKILYFEMSTPPSGSASFKSSYSVKRREVRGLSNADGAKVRLTGKQRQLFLTENQMVPLTGKHLDLLSSVGMPEDRLDVARVLYQRVDEHVRYDKSQQGYGNGDVLWVCDSRSGNCTDFHSLFISLARSQGLPARFEIGFPLPPARGEGTIGGYHCWALFHTEDRGWIPVDISEADKHPEMKEYYFGNLTENRVTFSVGRDIDLRPKQSAPPLNFFIYPHVEVNGDPLPKAQIQLNFAYTDM